MTTTVTKAEMKTREVCEGRSCLVLSWSCLVLSCLGLALSRLLLSWCAFWCWKLHKGKRYRQRQGKDNRNPGNVHIPRSSSCLALVVFLVFSCFVFYLLLFSLCILFPCLVCLLCLYDRLTVRQAQKQTDRRGSKSEQNSRTLLFIRIDNIYYPNRQHFVLSLSTLTTERKS